jgi:protein-S-isoprenylcysteine O-methyltransferase Ste14
MVSVSILGRHWAIRSLGPFHSIHLEIRDHHVLVSTGAYQFVRNPHCLSNIFEPIGLPLLAGSRSSLATSFSVNLPLLVQRMIREEAVQSGELGPSFARYKREVAMIISTRLSVNKSAALNATFIETSAEQANKP